MKQMLSLLPAFFFCSSGFFNIAQAQEKAAHGVGAGHKPAALKEQSIHISGPVNLEFVEYGSNSGTPVVFLHGYTDSWHSFENVLEQLPSNIHAIAVSQRGHGNSARPQVQYHPKDLARDIAVLLKKKNMGKVIIVGHSMGGVIAQQFALDYPNLTMGLILVSTDACLNNNPPLIEFQAAVMQLQDPVSYEFSDEFQKSTLYKPIDPDYYKLLVAEGHKVPAHVWKAAMAGFMSVDYTLSLKNVTQPTLILWGDKDQVISRGDQEVLVKAIPGARLVVYEETGHALHWENPEKFVADLVEFVNEVSGAPKP